MIAPILNLFRVEEIRKRIFVTLGLMFVYRIGWHIPLPGVDFTALTAFLEKSADKSVGSMIGLMSALSGANLQAPVVFSLGVLPYISASIIFSLLVKVIPSLEALSKEGAAGQRKINQYSRLLTVPLALGQAIVLCMTTFRSLAHQEPPVINGFGAGFVITSALGITAGTIFLMWIGEQITEYGVGNGISLLIVAGIVDEIPLAFGRLLRDAAAERTQLIKVVVLAAVYLAIVIGVIFMSKGQRRIPMQQAKQMKGRRMIGGVRHYLPIKLNMANVMPVIFASSLLVLPMQIMSWITRDRSSMSWLAYGSWLHVLLYTGLIVFFSYFWTSLMFQPTEIANNLKEQGSFVPGIRPGRKTAEFLERVLVRITLVGAFFLAIIAVIPEVASKGMGVDQLVAGFLGGTGILIVVGVTLDVVDKLNASLLMRNYEGFMGAGKSAGRSR
jgi:preprotein translocase subunit SecY